jgi:hypothetical protein
MRKKANMTRSLGLRVAQSIGTSITIKPLSLTLARLSPHSTFLLPDGVWALVLHPLDPTPRGILIHMITSPQLGSGPCSFLRLHSPQLIAITMLK